MGRHCILVIAMRKTNYRRPYSDVSFIIARPDPNKSVSFRGHST